MGAESPTERIPYARRASALEAEPPLCRGLRLARELRGEACGRERAAAMLDARIPTGGQGKGKSARRPFSSFQGRVTERVSDGTERPAPAAAASSSAREGAERPSREDAARLFPQWLNDQFQDLEERKRARVWQWPQRRWCDQTSGQLSGSAAVAPSPSNQFWPRRVSVGYHLW